MGQAGKPVTPWISKNTISRSFTGRGESRKMALADFVSRTPLNPDMFEQKLMCNDTKVGTQQEGYKDSELWAVG